MNRKDRNTGIDCLGSTRGCRLLSFCLASARDDNYNDTKKKDHNNNNNTNNNDNNNSIILE